MFSVKNTPLSFLTGYSYERVNVFHRTVAMIGWAEGVVHTVTIILALNQAVPKRTDILFRPVNILGIVSLALWSIMMFTFPLLKKRFYECFFFIHIILFPALAVTVYFHHPRCRIFVWVGVGIFVLDRIVRCDRMFWHNRFANQMKAAVEIVPGENLLITIPRPAIRWTPGSHVFLRLPWLSFAQSHPFTILTYDNAPTAASTKNLQLLIHPAQGQTRKMYDMVKAYEKENGSNCNVPKQLTAYIDGPYGTSSNKYGYFDSVILFATGSGVTYISPIALHLIRHGSCKRIEFVWSIRQREDLVVMQERLRELASVAAQPGHHPSRLTLRLHYTGPKESEGPITNSMLVDEAVRYQADVGRSLSQNGLTREQSNRIKLQRTVTLDASSQVCRHCTASRIAPRRVRKSSAALTPPDEPEIRSLSREWSFTVAEDRAGRGGKPLPSSPSQHMGSKSRHHKNVSFDEATYMQGIEDVSEPFQPKQWGVPRQLSIHKDLGEPSMTPSPNHDINSYFPLGRQDAVSDDGAENDDYVHDMPATAIAYPQLSSQIPQQQHPSIEVPRTRPYRGGAEDPMAPVIPMVQLKESVGSRSTMVTSALPRIESYGADLEDGEGDIATTGHSLPPSPSSRDFAYELEGQPGPDVHIRHTSLDPLLSTVHSDPASRDHSPDHNVHTAKPSHLRSLFHRPGHSHHHHYAPTQAHMHAHEPEPEMEPETPTPLEGESPGSAAAATARRSSGNSIPTIAADLPEPYTVKPAFTRDRPLDLEAILLQGRPDIATIIRDVINESQNDETVAIGACGTTAMLGNVRRAACEGMRTRGEGRRKSGRKGMGAPSTSLFCEEFGW